MSGEATANIAIVT